MGLPNKQLDELDALIEAALQQSATVSQQQKQCAWERLNHTVQYQTVLPAALTVAEKGLFSRLMIAGGILWHQFSALATDEDRYKMANRNRHLMRYHGISQTGEIVMQLL